MKKILTNLPLIIFSLMFIAGVTLGALAIAQYHIESIPTDKELRMQVDEVYDEITEEDIDAAREEAAGAEDIEEFVIKEIKGEQSGCIEISMHQNGVGFSNAQKTAAKKLDIVLGDIETGKTDALKAYVATRKITHKAWEYKDIIKVPYSDELNIFRTVEKMSFLSAILIVSGTVGVIVTILRKRRKCATSPEAEEQT